MGQKIAFDEGTKKDIELIMKMLSGDFDPDKDTPGPLKIEPKDLKKLL
jgi:hypothetical protein